MASVKMGTETAVLMNDGTEIDRVTVEYPVNYETSGSAFQRACQEIEVRRGYFRWDDIITTA